MSKSTSSATASDAAAIWVVIPAAGSGSRFGGATPKQFLPLAGTTVLQATLQRLLSHPNIAGAVVAMHGNERHRFDENHSSGKPILTCAGGAQRADSVIAGLRALQSHVQATDLVIVHDAARPCVSHQDLNKLIALGSQHKVGAILACRLRDTIKQCSDKGESVQTLNRDVLWRAQTPQMFRYADLLNALQQAQTDNAMPQITDEASAFERLGKHPLLVEGDESNIKITQSKDLELAAWILNQQAAQQQ